MVQGVQFFERKLRDFYTHLRYEGMENSIMSPHNVKNAGGNYFIFGKCFFFSKNYSPFQLYLID